MTAPYIAPPDPNDPLEQLKAMQADPLAQLKAMRQAPAPQRTFEASTGPDPMQSYGMRLATHVLNAAQGIPGMRAVEAGAGALGSQFTSHPMGYRQALGQLDEMTGNIGGATSVGEKALGATATLPWLPANPAMAGGLLGGADQALDANPDESLLSRGVKTAAGGAVGALTGRTLDRLMTVARAKMPGLAESAYSAVADRMAGRAATADQLYGKALTEGVGKTDTPAIQRMLAKPQIAEIVSELSGLDRFQGMAPHDPRMLDAVYKVLGDQAQAIRKPLAGAAPTRPNLGRFNLDQIQSAQRDLLDAMAGGKSLPGPMPKYRDAVDAFAEASRGIDAAKRGNDVVRASRITIPAGNNLTRTTPDAFAAWAAKASPAERQAALQGMLGAMHDATMVKPAKVFGIPVLPTATKVGAAAPGLLRSVGSRTSNATLAGLLGLHAATP